MLDLLNWDKVKPGGQSSEPTLCDSCSNIDSTLLFPSRCDVSRLRSKARTCDICRLLLQALEQQTVDTQDKSRSTISLRQTNSLVGVQDGPDLLSVYVAPSPSIPPGSQLGLPVLLTPASLDQFTLMQEWINICDTTHEMCAVANEKIQMMPTRLLQVNGPLRLVHAAKMAPTKYLALSHCWGPLKENQKFCTYKRNIAQFQVVIDESDLPRTFSDAVSITRGLGIDFIWIDSLCIVQDDPSDWESESKKMEQVFSAAYCTISASSADSSLAGFISEREPRPFVRLSTANVGEIYVCPAIDNFHRDVECSKLNSRGWVLQERALSRRSIHFTSTQIYWECGSGVRCETLGCLTNLKAAFLGDANFPRSVLEYYRDGRQMLIQDLYERYSALAFTKPSDRAVAILGLQARLAKAFRTPSAYGIFAMYLPRGLLWKRGQIAKLKRVIQPAGRCVPTWSWLSVDGAIKYMELEFEKIAWATEDFENPFNQQREIGYVKDYAILRACTRKLHLQKLEMFESIVFDTEQDGESSSYRCVVIGRDKVSGSENVENQRCHVIVVRQRGGEPGRHAYERVGVGSIKAHQMDSAGFWVNIY